MIHLKRRRLAWVLVALLGVLLIRTAGLTRAHASSCSGWSIVPSPNPYTGANVFAAVAAISATDVWAVGYGGNSHSPDQPLIEHWDGTSWQVITSPGGAEHALYSVAALSAQDIWAVGASMYSAQTLIEHWDGSQWRITPSPSVGSFLNYLSGVTAISATDIWAVGFDQLGSGAPYRTLIEHWDGSQWRIVKSPNVGSYDNYLWGTTALSASDVWTVGGYLSAQRPLVGHPLVEHWDGSHWSLIHAPGANPSDLRAVAAVTANQVWAVGGIGAGTTLTERWMGSRWQRVTSPNPSRGTSRDLASVAAGASNDIWAVSNYFSIDTDLDQTLTEHWDGTQWQIVVSPNVAAQENYLTGVAVVPSSTVAHAAWAVGYTLPKGGFTSSTLIEYYC